LALTDLILPGPSLGSILCGALVGILGLALRRLGCPGISTSRSLTVTGPYAYTRNPFFISGRHIGSRRGNRPRAFLDFLREYSSRTSRFSILSSCARRTELRRALAEFDAYAAAVLYFPRLPPQDWEGRSKFLFHCRSTEKITMAGRVRVSVTADVLLLIWRFRAF